MVCIEQNPDYARAIQHRCHNLFNGPEDARIILGDSRNMELLSTDSMGLVVTSPPYWNKADYGEGASNLGNEPVYTRFLERISPVFKECFRVLMPGRRLVW